MALLGIQDVTLNLGTGKLLDGATLHVEQGERICLVGRNGAGKSTLLRLMAGDVRPDAGEITRAPGARFGCMPQEVPTELSGPVFGIVAGGLGAEGKALAAFHVLEAAREAGNPVDEAALAAARRGLESGEGWEHYGDVLSVCNHLRLDPEREFATLSGGRKRRVLLARALVASQDLLLDEPTNHIDIDTIAWLEDYLLRRARTLVFVSHDRAFVRRLATRIVEVDRGKLHSYACGYDQYQEQREARLENEERQFALFDKKLAQEEVWVRQGIKARRTRNMGRVRALYALREERARRRERQGGVAMLAQEAERSGKLVIEARNVCFAHENARSVLRDFSALIQRGDRVGLIGPNGSGKTTLLRLLLGQLTPHSGEVRHGTRLEIAYFDQLRSALDGERSVMDNVAEGADTIEVNGNRRHVAGYLRDFLFEPDRLRLPAKVLSGGERNRLLLAKLFTRPSNLLVLDEPTNDLDVETLDLLEELLAEYQGTVLLVSHDRAFLDDVVTSTLAFDDDGNVREYVGGYTDWLRQRPKPSEEAAKAGTTPGKADAVQAGQSGQSGQAGNSGSGNGPGNGQIRKLTFKEQRELAGLREALAALPGNLDALEQEQATLEARLAEPDFFTTDPEGFSAAAARVTALEGEQTALLERWELVEARIAELAQFRE